MGLRDSIWHAEGIPQDLQRLMASGRQIVDGELSSDLNGSTGFVNLSLPGGGKKRKKKTYTTPKKVRHMKKNVPLAVLKCYQVQSDGSVMSLKKICPNKNV